MGYSRSERAPAPHLQSRWVAIWSHINIYYAMNYILSSFCEELNEFALFHLLKQLCVAASRCEGEEQTTLNKTIRKIWKNHKSNELYSRLALQDKDIQERMEFIILHLFTKMDNYFADAAVST